MRAGVGVMSGAAEGVRARRPFLDHAIRAYARYTADGGDRLAAAATYFAFLSFFPLVALAFAVTGFVVDAYPDVHDSLTRQINDYLPGLADRLDVSSIGHAKVGVGVIGLLALLLAGLAWIDALRDAVRLVWHQDTDAGSIITRRLRDITVLAGLGVTLLASLVVTSLATSATGDALDWIGLSGSAAAGAVAAALALLLALAMDTAVFLYLFWRLPWRTDRHRAARGALLGAVGLEILKIIGTWLVGQATGNPVYGAFAVIVGLLIWINIVMRWTLYVAAWTVTAPYASDVYPSGTADRPGDGGVGDGGVGAVAPTEPQRRDGPPNPSSSNSSSSNSAPADLASSNSGSSNTGSSSPAPPRRRAGKASVPTSSAKAGAYPASSDRRERDGSEPDA